MAEGGGGREIAQKTKKILKEKNYKTKTITK
jgi:hypothetical protein